MAKLVDPVLIFCFALIFSIEPDDLDKQIYSVTPAFFMSSQGAFEWTFVSHSLRSTPVVLRRIVDTIWDPGDNGLAPAQPDGIFENDVESSWSDVSLALETSSCFNLKLNPEKCEIDCTKIDFSSCRIPEEGTNKKCHARICSCY